MEDRHIRELNKNDAVKEQVLPAIKVACYEDEQFYELSKVLFKDTLKLIGDAKFQGHQSMTKDFAEVRRIILEIAREFETAARDGRIQKEAIDKGWKSWIYCNILKMFYLLAASGYLCAALMNGTLITLDSRQRHSFVEMFERLACEGHDLLGRMIIQLMQKEHQSVAMWLRHRLSASLPTRMILLVMSGTLEVIKVDTGSIRMSRVRADFLCSAKPFFDFCPPTLGSRSGKGFEDIRGRLRNQAA